MKKLYVLLLAIIALFTTNCTKNHTPWQSQTMEENLVDYRIQWWGNGIEIKFYKDGKFFFESNSYLFNGTYKTKGNEIIFTIPKDGDNQYEITNAIYSVNSIRQPSISAHFKFVNTLTSTYKEFDFKLGVFERGTI